MRPSRNIERIIACAFGAKTYASHDRLVAAVLRQQGEIADASVRHVLWEMCDMGVVHCVGRGWYSVQSNPATLPDDSVKPLADFLRREFPWVETLCWSTHQVAALCPHLPMKYYNFVHVARDGMRDVGLKLERQFPDARVMVNPTARDRSWMTPAVENYVVRPLTADNRKGPGVVPSVGSLLVELSLEREQLSLFDEADFRMMLSDVLNGGWVNPGEISRHLRRRGLARPAFGVLLRELAERGANLNERQISS